MNKVFLFLLLSFSLALRSQNSIKGIIIDENKNPIPYINIALFSLPDSILCKGELSSENGNFFFDDVKNGKYYMKIIAANHPPTIQNEIQVNGSEVDLGSIMMLTVSKELNAASIIAEKPFIEKQADKTIINVENNIIQQGSSVMEVLEKLPGVQVDQNGNIRIRGKQGVIVMMDGKPSVLSGQDFANLLRGMSSSNIQKIEIITNPSAKWDAAGNAGILNIITKKNKREGINGSASFTYGQGRYAKYNSSFNLNYKREKINFFFNYGFANRKGFNNLKINRKFYERDTLKTTFVTDNYIIFPFINHAPRLGIDFYLSKKTTLSVLGSTVSNTFNSTTRNHTDILGLNEEKISAFNFSEDSKNKYYNLEFNAQLNHKFDTLGQEITIHADQGKYWNKTNEKYSTLYIVEPSQDSSYINLNGKQIGSLYLYAIKADYTKPLNKDLTFESGLKSSYVESDKDMRFYNLVDNTESFDSARSSHFIYGENINAAYVNLNKKFNKLTVQSGLRAEQTLANGKQILNNSSFKRNYVQIFPTIYLDYQFSDKHGVNINLGRRINRPHYEQMNPFKQLIDFTTYSEGNPYLLPQLTYNSELTYSFKNVFFTTFNYSYTTNNITDVLIQDSETKTTIQGVVNLNKLNYYSLDLAYTKRMNKWWKTNTSILSYYAIFTGTINKYYINQGQPSFYVNSNNSFSIVDGLSAECNFQYNHQNLYGVTLDRTTYNLTVGVQKSILKKQGTLTLNCTDILWKAYPWGITQFGNVNEDWVSRRDTRVVNMGFTYKFGNSNAGKMRRETGADEEKQRI